MWLGASAMVGAFARVNYFIYPSLYSEWVYTGDALRLGWQVLLFIGAAREIQLYQRGYAQSRVLEERRRIARDLHDGLAQELAFMVTTTRKMVDARYGDRELIQLASAAERALDESRRGIASLTQRNSQPFDAALVQTVEEVGGRLGAQVVVTADAAPRLTQERQEQLLRIVREAVTNAVRHGSANVVRVEFSNGRGLALANRGRRRRVRPGGGPPQRLRPHRHARASCRARRSVVRRVDVGGNADRGGPAVTKMRVLVADDHPPTRAGVRLALERGGFEVCSEAADAATAVALARRDRPDVCLLDINMPGNGIHAAEAISQELPETAVVMLTVSRTDSDLFDALRAGASGYLLKDIDPARLPLALHGVLEGEAALPRHLVALLIEEFRERKRRRRIPLRGRRSAELTDREWEVLELMRNGASTEEIASRLFISPVTVRDSRLRDPAQAARAHARSGDRAARALSKFSGS